MPNIDCGEKIRKISSTSKTCPSTPTRSTCQKGIETTILEICYQSIVSLSKCFCSVLFNPLNQIRHCSFVDLKINGQGVTVSSVSQGRLQFRYHTRMPQFLAEIIRNLSHSSTMPSPYLLSFVLWRCRYFVTSTSLTYVWIENQHFRVFPLKILRRIVGHLLEMNFGAFECAIAL